MSNEGQTPLRPIGEKNGDVEATIEVSQLAVGSGELPPPPVLTAEEERRLWRKVDMRLIPISTLLYLVSYLDRGNIGELLLHNLRFQSGQRTYQTMQEMRSSKDFLHNLTSVVSGTISLW